VQANQPILCTNKSQLPAEMVDLVFLQPRNAGRGQ
jgi:hypothetical protein